MSPIAFLDFDDVLAIHPVHNGYRVLDAFSQETVESVPELWADVFNLQACRNLSLLHDEFRLTYVITSSWVLHLSHEQTVEVLNRTGLNFVATNLHKNWTTPRNDSSTRLDEVEKWLDQYLPAPGHPYVIIDDHISGGAFNGSWIEDKVVLCDAWVGFVHPKLRTARKILIEQRTPKGKKS